MKQCETNREKVYKKLPPDKAATVAFEYDCMHGALSAGRKLTVAEEDAFIESYSGSRTGTRDPYGPPKPLGPPQVGKTEQGQATEQKHPLLLPNPYIRQKHRAGKLGGPTTEGEPNFTEYYKREYGTLPPDELREDDVDVYASDGRLVSPEMLDIYEEKIASGEWKTLQQDTAAFTEEAPSSATPSEGDALSHLGPRYVPKDPTVTQSFSELGAPKLEGDE
jgi:hypothetical protein